VQRCLVVLQHSGVGDSDIDTDADAKTRFHCHSGFFGRMHNKAPFLYMRHTFILDSITT